MQQTLLPKNELKYLKARTHGGMKLKKRRKVARPLVAGAVTHLVLTSSKAKGEFSFYRHKKVVEHLLRDRARLYFIEIIDFVNMGNHLHIKVRFKDTVRFKNFLRAFCGLLPRKLTHAHRGTRFGRFWDGLAYTRVLLTKLEEFGLRAYFEGNRREKDLGPQARETYLKHWNQFLYRLRKTRAAPASTA
jgi:REP element-mobilizing transposase RayT